MPTVAVGIGVGLVASFVQSLGLTVQRKSHLDNTAQPPAERRHDWHRPLWVTGFLVFISANFLGTLFQIGALPLVVLGPLGAVSLVYNAFLAHVVLKDEFSRSLAVGTVLIACGAALIGSFGVVADAPARSIDELLHLYTRPSFLVWFVGLMLLVGLMLSVAYGLDEMDNTLDEAPRPSRLLSFAEHSEHTLCIVGGLLYASCSGIMSGVALLFAKTGIDILVATFVQRTSHFFRTETCAIILALVISTVLQLVYLNKALRLIGPTLVCPLAFCFFSLCGIISGIMYQDQWHLLSSAQVLLVSVGTAILFGGVWTVSMAAPAPAALPETASPVPEQPQLVASPRAETSALLKPHADRSYDVLYPDSHFFPDRARDPAAAREPVHDDDSEHSQPPSPSALKRPRRGPPSISWVPPGFTVGLGAYSPGFAVSTDRRGSTHERSTESV